MKLASRNEVLDLCDNIYQKAADLRRNLDNSSLASYNRQSEALRLSRGQAHCISADILSLRALLLEETE